MWTYFDIQDVIDRVFYSLIGTYQLLLLLVSSGTFLGSRVHQSPPNQNGIT